jgi:hypothetical protein
MNCDLLERRKLFGELAANRFSGIRVLHAEEDDFRRPYTGGAKTG